MSNDDPSEANCSDRREENDERWVSFQLLAISFSACPSSPEVCRENSTLKLMELTNKGMGSLRMLTPSHREKLIVYGLKLTARIPILIPKY